MYNKLFQYLRGQNKSKLKFGFTIVELIVIIAIIGILAAISLVSYNGMTQRAAVVTLQSDLDHASSQLASEMLANGIYPLTDADANNGNGLVASPKTVYTYIYGSDKKYCLAASNGDVSYYITSDNDIPREGTCHDIAFASAWGGINDDNGKSLIQTSDGGYVVTGETKSYGAGAGDMFINKYDYKGNLSWSKTWGGVNEDKGTAIIQSSSGGYVITGTTASFGSGANDVFIIKYDVSGNLLWNRTWGGSSSEFSESITQTNDNGYVITGETTSYGSADFKFKMFVVKYDSAGNFVWNKTWGGINYDYGNTVIKSNDGGCVVSGYTNSFGEGVYDAFLAKYDINGTLVWNKTWGGTGVDMGYSVVQTNDDGYLIIGYTISFGAGSNDIFVAKYDSSGNFVWDKTWGGTSNDRGYSIAQSTDGSFVITGDTFSFTTAGGYDTFLAKFDISGNFVWNSLWGGVNTDTGRQVIKTSDDGYSVVGETNSFGAGLKEVFLVKYDNNGSMFNCASNMCHTSTANTTPANGITNVPSASIMTPTSGSSIPNATVTNPTGVITSIVAP